MPRIHAVHCFALVCLLLAWPGSARAQDPGVASGAPVTTADYDLSNTGFTTSEGIAVEERGQVYYPTALDQGPYPVVLFLHGRHRTCYNIASPTSTLMAWPCAAGMAEIPSYKGYEEPGRILASNGFIVISIGANGINAVDNSSPNLGMPSRGELVQRHLDIWAGFNSLGGAPFGTLFVNQLDLSNVGTMGHSRGGEGVAFHYLLNRDRGSPYGVRAVFPLAPVDFFRKAVHGVPLGVLLPYCDGDVATLHGAGFYDDARYDDPSDPASKFYFLAMGTNHNFYNSVWTPGGFVAGTSDDADVRYSASNPTCGSSSAARLTAAQQRTVSNAYLAGFFRHYLKGESEFLPQLRGDMAAPPSTAPAVLHNTFHPPALQRLDVNRTSTSSDLTTDHLGGAVSSAGLSPYGLCGSTPCTSSPRNAHQFSPPFTTELELGWNATTAQYHNAVPVGQRDLSRFDTLSFRAAVDPEDARNPVGSSGAFSVILSDGSGGSLAVSTAGLTQALYYPPGTGFAQALVLNTVRVPLSAFSGVVDLANVTDIAFGFDQQSTGALFVADLALSSTASQAASDIVMVLDRSGSMSALDFEPGNTETRLQAAAKAARFFAASLDPTLGHRVAVVSYNHLAESRLGFVDVDGTFDPNAGAFSDALDQLLLDGPAGSTSIGAGVEEALAMIPSFSTTGQRSGILLLTDGRQNRAPCIAVGDGLGGWNTGDCNALGLDSNLVKETDPRLHDTAVCSVGMGRAAGQVDETILEDFSTRFISAQANVTNYNATMSAFSKCAPELGPGGTAVDPAGLLPADRVTTPPFSYAACADRKLTFVSSWHRTLDSPGDMRFLVSAPDGALFVPSGPGAASRSVDWDIQRVSAPAAGNWRFQLMRDHTRIVNGFTSDAFADRPAGESLVQDELQRLCPNGCKKVLYFEDGRVGARSVYADVLSRLGPSGTGLIGGVEAFDQKRASDFAKALESYAYDLLVYVHQLDGDPHRVEPYDGPLQRVLCEGTSRALITDTRAPAARPGESSRAFHECSGAAVSATHTNYKSVVDPDGTGTLLATSRALVNRGYATFSYSIGAQPFDRLAHLYQGLSPGATQLEGGTDQPFLEQVADGVAIPFGAIVTFSADRAVSAKVDPKKNSSLLRSRFAEQWSTEVRFEGPAPINPRVQLDEATNRLDVSVLLDVGAARSSASTAWVKLIRPTEDLAKTFARLGCSSKSPKGDQGFSDRSLSPDDIPVVTELHALSDDGKNGDAFAGDGVLSTSIPADVQGTYELTYYVEVAGADIGSASCASHREARVTTYVGSEVMGNGAACPPKNPKGVGR